MKAVSLWSGGKDSCFASYKALSSGHQILSLFNFVECNGRDSLSHGLSSELIRRQVNLIDMPLLQKEMPNVISGTSNSSQKSYEEEFKALIREWQDKKDIEGIVFGDIYLKEHRDWIENVCKELDTEPIFPLWGMETEKIILDFIDSGFEAIVVSARQDILDSNWLGRKVDKRFIEELRIYNPDIDPCGENGEFHTFVYNGPIFKKPLGFITGEKVLKGKNCFLELG